MNGGRLGDDAGEGQQGGADFLAVEEVAGRLDSGVLLLCDHASNALPKSYGTLGLAEQDLERHIAYDIGAADMTRRLAERLSAPALLTRFSRLLIDPNRGEDDPTLVMRLSDCRIVPGNAHIDQKEIEKRRTLYWQPYRDTIASMIAAMSAKGPHPAVFSLHTFTPTWRGVPRAWQIAALWDNDARLAKPLMTALRSHGLSVGDNEPYDGALRGDTLYDQVTRRGLAGVLIETRQDLVDTPAKAQGFADLLAEIIKPILARPEMHRREKLTSRADAF
ncbi:MAG: N-formylglutamate amidohydrolase [Methylovirgula sp.]|jgi:predicted N-formylglutamate amidohydrolase